MLKNYRKGVAENSLVFEYYFNGETINSIAIFSFKQVYDSKFEIACITTHLWKLISPKSASKG